jgi:hypothetical protein
MRHVLDAVLRLRLLPQPDGFEGFGLSHLVGNFSG